MINDDAKKIHKGYQKIYQSLSQKITIAENDMFKGLVSNANNLTKKKIQQITDDYKDELKSIMEKSSNYALTKAKEYKNVQYQSYIQQVKQLAKKYNVEPNLYNVKEMIPLFGDGMDEELLNKVWNKAYPDKLNVDDRINKLSKSINNQINTILKNGINEGKSAVNIAKEIRQIKDIGIERRSAIRLAGHTTNLVYQTAQAEISMQASFVMGIRIVRGMYGNVDLDCDICNEHAGDDFKEYFKEDFGGRDADMWIMTNAPAYHCNCSCGVEEIFESPETFIKNAREEYKIME